LNKLKIKKFKDNAILPTRAYPTDAGLDFYSPVDISIPYGKRVRINTHIGIALFEGTVGLILDRSSIANQGIRNLGGVIDANYRGEIHIILAYVATDHDGTDIATYSDWVTPWIQIKRGDKIAQMIITAAYTPEILEVKELDITDRGVAGFGSSGR
jgi:dUTP diphosphatase